MKNELMSVNVSRNINRVSGSMYTRIGLKNRAFNAFTSNYIRLAYVNGRLYFKESSEGDTEAVKLYNNTGSTSIFFTVYDNSHKVTDRVKNLLKSCKGEHPLCFDVNTHSYYFNTEENAKSDELTFADKVNELCGGATMSAEDFKESSIISKDFKASSIITTDNTDNDIYIALKEKAYYMLENDKIDEAVILAKAAKLMREEIKV